MRPDNDFPIVLAGGNLEHEGSLLAKHLKQKLADAFPGATIASGSIQADKAAALLAMKQQQASAQ